MRLVSIVEAIVRKGIFLVVLLLSADVAVVLEWF